MLWLGAHSTLPRDLNFPVIMQPLLPFYSPLIWPRVFLPPKVDFFLLILLLP